MSATNLLLFLVLLVISNTNSSDLYLGYLDTNSRLIYNKVHQENPAIWVRSEDITVNCSKTEIINAIQIMDLREDKLGEVYVKRGGIGDKFVTIELDSPSVFRGYNFWVQVYAIESNGFYKWHGRK